MPSEAPSPSTARTPSAMNPQDMMAAPTPLPRSHSGIYGMNGRPPSGTISLGIVEVSGRSRVPSPPARISACTPAPPGSSPASAPDPLVDEAGPPDPLRVDEVTSVDDQRAGHPLAQLEPVELGELGPFGDHDHGIGALGRLERRASELDPRHQLARLILGDRVIGPYARPVGLQPGGQHQRRGLAHVIGIGLEG